MMLRDTTVYLFRCGRCKAAFVLTGEEIESQNNYKWALLLATPCRVCGKTWIEYLGEFVARQQIVESTR